MWAANSREWWCVCSTLHESDVAVVVDASPEVQTASDIWYRDDRELQSFRGMDCHDSDALCIAWNVGFTFTRIDFGLPVDPMQ